MLLTVAGSTWSGDNERVLQVDGLGIVVAGVFYLIVS